MPVNRDRRSAWIVGAACAVALAGAGVGPGAAAAQEVSFHGQVRPRYELRDPAGTGERDTFTSMRVRAALDAALDERVRIFVQVQDVRLFGEETNTLGDFRADNFDLHQGWLEFGGEHLPWLRTRLGRQEVNLGGQRLVGAVGWTQQGRSFDGARLMVSGERGTLNLIGFKLAEESSAANEADQELFGAYGTLRSVGPGALDLYWLFHRAERDGPDTREHTLGARYAWSGAVDGRLEASLQTGDRGDEDASAFMVGARLGRSFAEGRAGLTLWYDYLSGDDDASDGESSVFNTLFATNHKFYGFADLFLNVPVHTGGAGLQDLALKGRFTPRDDLALSVDLHRFQAAAGGLLADDHFADEIDLTVRHRYSPHLTMTAGLSRVFNVDGLREVGRLERSQTWLYVMFDALF